MLFDTIATLAQVYSTDGVSYAVFITALAAILASFIAVIGVLTNMTNTRLIRIEDKIDKTNESLNLKLDKTNETLNQKFNDTNQSLFLIKANLGIIPVAEKSQAQKDNEDKTDN
jgi:hypothetical protein